MSLRIPRRMGRFSRVTRSTGKVSPRLLLAQRLAQVQNHRGAPHFQANLLVPFWGVDDRPCFEGRRPVDKILVERDFRSKIRLRSRFLARFLARHRFPLGVAGSVRACRAQPAMTTTTGFQPPPEPIPDY